MLLRTTLAAFVALALAPAGVRAAESYDNCTGFIDSLPVIISAQGTWCLRKDLSTPISWGAAIQVSTNNVTIDCNGFKLGNLEAGASSGAQGVMSADALNISVRNCNVRGFNMGLALYGLDGGNHLVENNRIEGSIQAGIWVAGDGSVVRDNAVKGIAYAETNYGIYTEGGVDVIRNLVDGVTSASSNYGIYLSANDGGSVARNRIRNIVAGMGSDAIGIKVTSTQGMSFRENFVSSASGSKGIVCPDTAARAQGNVIQGYAQGLVDCGDAGDNDVSP